ncbi:isatin hydrolase-like [Ylistrum balloti]|uniref:isatin hydrolase-like n=1 Tax=Ylistrum balloti TaxID=509963 RepID=UPI002905CA2D|nr:isatin hydrolase-like [Ylistrum balloti]XP_060083576.1 isatin hydrolase-like [Ylistrum balloti]XP_060083577.1 isatin hydrolase-like [Ylistrum balloti]
MASMITPTMLVVILLLCGLDYASMFQVLDLTHDLSAKTLYWPGNPSYNFTELARGQMDNFWYESNFIATAEHGGTHVDSPAHFYEGGWRTQQIPMERLTGPGVVIDVKDKARDNPDYRVLLNDITEWESVNGRIPDNAAVIMNSGWGAKYPNKTAVFGTETPSVPSTFHFPAWHQDTVTWLINQRHVYMIGVDTPSTDFGQSSTFPTHVVLSKHNVVGLENVANLDTIPVSGTRIFAAVTKIKDGSGGPARIFATISTEDEKCTNSGPLRLPLSVLSLICVGVATIMFMYHDEQI